VWNTHDTVFGSKRSAVCAVYFLHSTRPSVTWLYSRSSLAACDSLMSALSAVPSTRVRRRRKFGEAFLYGVYRPEKWLWIDSSGNWTSQIPAVTGHPVEGLLVSNFHRSIIIAELWQPKVDVARRWKKIIFSRFLEKRSVMGNFQNSVPKVFIATPIDVLC